MLLILYYLLLTLQNCITWQRLSIISSKSYVKTLLYFFLFPLDLQSSARIPEDAPTPFSTNACDLDLAYASQGHVEAILLFYFRLNVNYSFCCLNKLPGWLTGGHPEHKATQLNFSVISVNIFSCLGYNDLPDIWNTTKIGAITYLEA